MVEETQLTVEQVEAICVAICEGDCEVVNLEIGGNNLATVNPDILARTLVKLEDLELDYTPGTGDLAACQSRGSGPTLVE